MSLLSTIIGGGVEGVGKAVSGVVSTIWGDKGAEQAAIHNENMATLTQYAAEFRKLEDRTLFDSFVDGVNRLIRPTIAGGTIGLFVYAVSDPLGFTGTMRALDLIPDQMWYILGAIIGFYFGARELQKHRDKKSHTERMAVAKAVIADQKTIASMKTAASPGSALIDDETFQREMADTSKPLSNAAIAEWNRRRGR